MQLIHNTHPIANRKYCETQDTSVFEQILRFAVTTFHRIRNRRKITRMLDLSPHLLADIGLTRSDVVDAISSSRSVNPVDVLNARRAARIAELTAQMGRRKVR